MVGKNHSTIITITLGNLSMARAAGDGSQIFVDQWPMAPIAAKLRGKTDLTKTNSRLGINAKTNSNNNFILAAQESTPKNGRFKTISTANRKPTYAHDSQSH